MLEKLSGDKISAKEEKLMLNEDQPGSQPETAPQTPGSPLPSVPQAPAGPSVPTAPEVNPMPGDSVNTPTAPEGSGEPALPGTGEGELPSPNPSSPIPPVGSPTPPAGEPWGR